MLCQFFLLIVAELDQNVSKGKDRVRLLIKVSLITCNWVKDGYSQPPGPFQFYNLDLKFHYYLVIFNVCSMNFWNKRQTRDFDEIVIIVLKEETQLYLTH